MSKPLQAAVVGAGIAGLIAAVDLARGGAQVRLYERAREPGGRARSREAGGFVFNQGPHALYNGGALRRALAEFGVEVTGGGPRSLEPAAIWGEERHPLPRHFRSVLAATPLTLGERARLLALFLALPRLDLAPWRGRPLSAFTARLPARPRALVHALARLSTYAHAPDVIDAAAALAQMRLATGGVTYVDGGWNVMVEGLARAARAAGARLGLESLAEGVARVDGKWRVGDFACDAVVLTTPPEIATALLPGSAKLAAAARAAIPARVISLDYGLRRLPRPGATFGLGVDAPLYFSVHSASARLAPEGSALLHAARYLAPGERVETEAVEHVKALVERLQPGFEAEILESARLLGLPVAHDSPCAARFGRMAPVVLDDAPGVYLAGDWVGEGAMLSDAAAKSAREAAAAALARA